MYEKIILNATIAGSLDKLGKQLGIKFKLILIEQLRYGCETIICFFKNSVDSKPDFAVMRLNAPLLSEFLEK